MSTLRAATFLTGRKSVFSNGERQRGEAATMTSVGDGSGGQASSGGQCRMAVACGRSARATTPSDRQPIPSYGRPTSSAVVPNAVRPLVRRNDRQSTHIGDRPNASAPVPRPEFLAAAAGRVPSGEGAAVDMGWVAGQLLLPEDRVAAAGRPRIRRPRRPRRSGASGAGRVLPAVRDTRIDSAVALKALDGHAKRLRATRSAWPSLRTHLAAVIPCQRFGAAGTSGFGAYFCI
jgi:hypothetical protein